MQGAPRLWRNAIEQLSGASGDLVRLGAVSFPSVDVELEFDSLGARPSSAPAPRRPVRVHGCRLPPLAENGSPCSRADRRAGCRQPGRSPGVGRFEAESPPRSKHAGPSTMSLPHVVKTSDAGSDPGEESADRRCLPWQRRTAWRLPRIHPRSRRSWLRRGRAGARESAFGHGDSASPVPPISPDRSSHPDARQRDRGVHALRASFIRS